MTDQLAQKEIFDAACNFINDVTAEKAAYNKYIQLMQKRRNSAKNLAAVAGSVDDVYLSFDDSKAIKIGGEAWERPDTVELIELQTPRAIAYYHNDALAESMIDK